MSTSLKLTNGDLAIGAGRSFETVSAGSKLSQDLKLWVLERIGTDPATPEYGSRLDGGVVNGQQVPSFIGQIGTMERLAEIRAEVNTLLAFFQQAQIDRIKRDTLAYRKSTLDPAEVLHRVDRIEAKQIGMSVLVRVWYTTLQGTTMRLTIPVEV